MGRTVKFLLIFVFLFLAVLAGCDKEEYNIEINPQKNGVERKISYSGNIPNQVKERIFSIYKKEIEPNTFCAVFEANMPNDVGGKSYYTTFSSDMGDITCYSERIRGDDNIYRYSQNLQRHINRVIDFLIEWFEFELKNEPNFIQLKTFLDTNLREDTQNLMLYLWLGRIVEDYNRDANREFMGRIFQYLQERDYFTAKELAEKNSMLNESFDFLYKLAVKNMGYSPGDANKSLLFLKDSELRDQSFVNFQNTKALINKSSEKENFSCSEPNDQEIYEIISYGFFGFGLNLDVLDFGDFSPKFTVKFFCKNQPFETNGRWDQDRKYVIWSNESLQNDNLPFFVYACYSVPDIDFQEKHFGNIVLKGQALSEYYFWRKNLEENKLKEWDTFVSGLSPSENIEKEISSFRFSDYKPSKNDSEEFDMDISRPIRVTLLKGLQQKVDK